MFRYICLIIPIHPNQPRRDPIFVYFTQECSAPVIIVSALVLPWWANIPGAVTDTYVHTSLTEYEESLNEVSLLGHTQQQKL